MATTKVSALSALTTADGAEEVLINDGGTSKKITIANANKKLFAFLDANGNYMQTEKGGDLTSASPLVIDTDGDYFDVTGTTNFAVMTVAADRQFTLQFDAVLTMTHHATNIDLPGEANITTAAGDVATFQSTGSNTVQCINYTRADGKPIVGAADATKLPLAGGEMSGNITMAGSQTVDGRDLSADGTKLDAIEASADVTDATNVTAAGALMDSELAGIAAVKATTGTFLTADQTKLDGIETSADVTDATNVTAAGALMDSELAGIAAVKATTGTFLSADESKLDAIEASADVTDATNVGTVVNGKQTIWVPANAMTPTASNGCADIAAVETTSGRPDMYVLDFDKDSDEHAQFTVAFPKSWNLSTVTYQAFWSGLAATTGVTWALQGVAMNDNETIDVAYGTAITVDDDAQSAIEELLVSAESGNVTIAGTPADNDLTYFRIFRDVSAGNDDMAGDARLHGVKIFFTTDALNDD